MIISASRRTDIPAFYHHWFMNRIREGFVLTRNPFDDKQISRVSLLKEDVDAIVFWTRNAQHMHKYLPELDGMGHNYYFQYTITGFPRILDAHTPSPMIAVADFSKLSKSVGAGKVVWRYDPILLCEQLPVTEHKRLFAKIAEMLEGKTERVVISFADLYKKTEDNLKKISGINYTDITAQKELMLDLVGEMSLVAKRHGMEILTCAEDVDLSQTGILKGKCIDDRLLEKEFGLRFDGKKDLGQRKECGCIKSIDIGQYNTCLHGCVYCYATANKEAALRNKERHDPDSPVLVGSIRGIDKNLLLPPIKVQQDLF